MKIHTLLLKAILVLCWFTATGPRLYSQDTAICFLRDPGGRIREHNVDFINMKLDVKFKEAEGMVLGNVKYDFKPIQFVVDTLFLNAPDIEIKKVLLDGLTTPFNTDSNGVTIRFLQPLNWNRKYKLEIGYEAHPRKGIYFIGWNVDSSLVFRNRGDQSLRYFTRRQIWTQGQGIDNRYWIPCYDDVNDKMITETTITFDSAYTVISNGVLKDKKKNTDGSATWHYAMSKPMVPYLIMLAIDKYAYKNFKSKNGMVSRQYYYADHPETVEPTYQYSAEMMDWLCSETGVPYPWETYANIPVQDFMYGAMENTTATVYGDFFLCDKRTNLERPYLGVNAHELTHQWFGDYVTEYSSAHHWLHESFATYYSKQFQHHVFGNDRYEWDKRGEQLTAINADKNDRFPVGHSRGGSPRVYPKGSAVLDMIRYVVGDSVFKRSVTAYLKKHAYANVLNEDFKMTFMETAGVNLDWLFEEWIYRSGYPQFEVKYEKGKDEVTFFINQKQKVDELCSYFKMPLVFEVHNKDGSVSLKKEWLSHASDTVHISTPANREIDFTLFDPGSNVIKVLDFKRSFEELTAQAEKAEHMIDRYDAVLAMRDTALELKRNLFTRIFEREKFIAVKNEIIFQLGKDTNSLSVEFLRKAIHDPDFQVRRSVVDNIGEFPKEFPVSILSDVEALLRDTSYYTIEVALRKLCKNNPDHTAVKRYLDQTSSIYGVNNNMRVTWLELNSLEADTLSKEKFYKELVILTSNQYEFRTRTRAFEKLELLQFCNDDLIKNLFNASTSGNGRLSGPAVRCLKSLIKKPENLQMAKGIFALNKWKDWEKKIIEPMLQ